jgi:hypothetical protein
VVLLLSGFHCQLSNELFCFVWQTLALRESSQCCDDNVILVFQVIAIRLTAKNKVKVSSS